MKAVRELGSERRETVRSISGAGARVLRGFLLSTRGPGGTHRWCTCYRANGKRRVAMCGADNRWKHLSGKPTSRWVLSWGNPVRSRVEHPLIGSRWKCSNTCSRGVLIDRGLDLKSIGVDKCYAAFKVLVSMLPRWSTFFPGVYGVVEPLWPISNSVVKRFCGKDSWTAASRKNSSMPG